VLGIAVAVAVFAGAGSYLSVGAFFDGFGPAFGVIAGLSAAGALASMALPGRRTVRALDIVGPRPAFEADAGA
jgi:hypothetical protein